MGARSSRRCQPALGAVALVGLAAYALVLLHASAALVASSRLRSSALPASSVAPIDEPATDAAPSTRIVTLSEDAYYDYDYNLGSTVNGTDNAAPAAGAAPASPLAPLVAGATVAILIHELSQTGAPRVATELARLLADAGASVRLMYVPADFPRTSAARRQVLAGASVYTADAHLSAELGRLFAGANASGMGFARLAAAASHDMVVANTAAPQMAAWVSSFRAAHPHHRGLIWFVHEASAVMQQFTQRDISATVRALPAADGLLFISSDAERYWAGERGVEVGTQAPTAASSRAAAAAAAHVPPPHHRPPPAAAVLHWGVPRWKLEQLTSPAFHATWRAAVRSQLGIPLNATVALSLGYFNPLKGMRNVYRAFSLARTRDCPQAAAPLHLVMAGAGGGNLLRWLGDEQLVRELRADSHVHVLGPVRAEHYLAASDLFVSNSLFGGESWGLATLEAATAGLALLASANGGTLEQAAHNETALLHSPALAVNRMELAAHLCALLSDAPLAARLSSEALRRAVARFGPHATESALAAAIAAVQARAVFPLREFTGSYPQRPKTARNASGSGSGSLQRSDPEVPPSTQPGSAIALRVDSGVLPAKTTLQACSKVAARVSAHEDDVVRRSHGAEPRYYTSPPSQRLFAGGHLYAPAHARAFVYDPLSAGYRRVEGADAARALSAGGAGSSRFVTTATGLLIVTHPDDELIFFGAPLMLAPAHTWVVVVVTQDGVRDLAGLCRRLRLAACVHLPHADAFTSVFDARVAVDLAHLLAAARWATIATHSLSGEYGHPQHVALHRIVRGLALALARATGRTLQLSTPARVPVSAVAKPQRGARGAAAASAATTRLNAARRDAVLALYPTIDTRLYTKLIAEYQALATEPLAPPAGNTTRSRGALLMRLDRGLLCAPDSAPAS